MDYPLKTPDQLRQQIRSLRKQRRLTQADLGALLGVTQARVVEIEAKPGAVSLQQMMQLLNALGVGLVVREAEAAAPVNEQPRRQLTGAAAAGITAHASAMKIKKGSW